MISLTLGNDEAGSRLDRIVRKKLSLKSLSAIYRLFRQGHIRINGKKAKAEYRIQDGDQLEIRTIDIAELTSRKSSDLSVLKKLVNTEYFRKNFNVLFEDETLLICNKPVHLPVHPGTGHLHNDTLIDLAKSYLYNKSSKSNYHEPVLVHRLDKETSGIILLAKNKQILRIIHKNFINRQVFKRYRAICHGIPNAPTGSISLELSRTHDRNSGTKMKVNSGGIHSKSRYSVIRQKGNLSDISIVLDTGKTHQIRVHMSHIGCPIVGDNRYGDKKNDDLIFNNSTIHRRMYLHAHQLSLPHPITNIPLNFISPVPDEFSEIIQKSKS